MSVLSSILIPSLLNFADHLLRVQAFIVAQDVGALIDRAFTLCNFWDPPCTC